MQDLLPWLNLLLVPVLLVTWRISALLARLDQSISSHETLDKERFGEVNRRLEKIEAQ